MSIMCHSCLKIVRSPEGTLVVDGFNEIDIVYWKNDKVTTLYFHPRCFEKVAGVKYMTQLIEGLR